MDYNDDEEFLQKLLATYKVEANEHIAGISAGLLALEKLTDRQQQLPIIEKIYREAHSLKGAAASVNLEETVVVCQSLESLFAALKRGERSLTPELFDLLHVAADFIGELALNTQPDVSSINVERLEHINQLMILAAKDDVPLVSKTENKAQNNVVQQDPLPVQEIGHKHDAAETIRIPVSKLDTLLLQAEELVSIKTAGRQHIATIKHIKSLLETWKDEWTKAQPEHRKIVQSRDKKLSGFNSVDLIDFLSWNYHFFKSMEDKLASLKTLVEDDHYSVATMVDYLMQDMKDVIMFPFSSILESFPKIVRDICRQQGKEVDISIQGADIEIDRRILQELKDPLLHIVRNCVDHGMERPDERTMHNKPARGMINVDIAQRDSSKVELTICDDGSGINVAKVKTAALSQGLITQEEYNRLDDTEAMQLILRSGLSTSPIVTNVSGRGLGLAIVSEKVEILGGTISIESTYGCGTTFHIVLPVTIATFRVILIKSGRQVFAIPAKNVERVISFKKDAVIKVKNKEIIDVDGRFTSLVSLEDVLGLAQDEDDRDGDSINVIVLVSGARRVAFVISDVLNEDEILVKGLGRQLVRVRNIAGATVLGTGKVALILNVSDLIKSAAALAQTVTRPPHHVKQKIHSILVVEDSITARMLLKNILESAGYHVKTAVDGVDGLATLREGTFDLVVSDIAMPRMNGFDLTERIRQDKRHADVPVVLVTGMESADDKRRGIEVGANAYIVKSSFDQNNLLEVIRRFMG
ncbi:MAG: response regulator [Nitrospirae bacterium]|nr:response regulator [Nitrospirota bacterium]